MTVPRAGAQPDAYQGVNSFKHCTIRRLENGKFMIRPYSLASTFVNTVKVKLFTAAYLRDGDIVSLVSLEYGPWFTFHTDEPTRSVSGVDGDSAKR